MVIGRIGVKSILLITLSNLGDIVLTTPVLTRLCREFPDAEIDIVTGSPGKQFFSLHPAVKHVAVPEKKRSLRRRIEELMEIREKRYDMVIDLKNSLIPYLSGARFRSNSFIDPRAVLRDIKEWDGLYSGHKTREHMLKLIEMGICSDMEGPDFFIPVSDEDTSYAEKLLTGCSGKKKVIINSGAKSHLKRWSAGKYAELADKLASFFSACIFFTGGSEDEDTVKEVMCYMQSEAVDLCGRTTVGALAALMMGSDIVITNDSAPLHIASAVNVPTIAIFGPTSETKYGPLSERSVVLKPDVECRPCEKALCEKGIDEGCISRVEVDAVFDAAVKILEDEEVRG